MAVETAEERAAREAAEAAEEARRREIEEEISRLEGEIATAEENIRQLMALKASCNDYQMEFEAARNMRSSRREEFVQLLGLDVLVGVYDGILGEVLNGTNYTGPYESMDEAKEKIRREIERQQQIIDECSFRIAGLRMEL